MGADVVAVQGVDYPADFAGAISGATNPRGAQGAKTMAQLAQKVVADCPTSKVVLAGYSQVCFLQTTFPCSEAKIDPGRRTSSWRTDESTLSEQRGCGYHVWRSASAATIFEH